MVWNKPSTWFTHKPAPTPPKRDAPLAPGQQGPVRPQPVQQGPVRPSDNEQVFRDTGVSTGGSSNRSRGGSSGGSRGGGGSSSSSSSNAFQQATQPATWAGTNTPVVPTSSTGQSVAPTASTSATQVKAGDSARLNSGHGTTESQVSDSSFLNKIGITRGDARPVKNIGALTLSPTEAMGMGKSSTPYVTTEGIGKYDALEFGSILSQTPVYGKTPYFGYTKKAYIENTNILESTKQTYIAETDFIKQFKANPEAFKNLPGFSATEKGYSITSETLKAGIDYDSIFKSSEQTAKQRYMELDKSAKRELIGSEIKVGVAKVVTGIPLAGLNVAFSSGTATINPDSLNDEFSWKTTLFGDGSRSIRFAPNTALGKIADAPTGWIGKTAQYGTTAGLVVTGAGLNVVKTGSWKEGLMETASYGGMYKIKSGVFTPQITSQDKMQINVIKLTDTGRIYKGAVSDSGVTFKAIESKGAGLIETKVPFAKISGGGSNLEYGSIFNTKAYITTNKPVVKVGGFDIKIPNQAGVGRTLSVIESNVIATAKGKIISTSYDATKTKLYGSATTITKATSKKGVNIFLSGKSKPIYSIGKGKTEFYYNPTGRYALKNTNIKGIEIDLTKTSIGRIDGSGIIKPTGDVGKSFTGGLVSKTITKTKIGGGTITTSTNIPSLIAKPVSTITQTAPLITATITTPKSITTTRTATQTITIPKMETIPIQQTKTTSVLVAPPITATTSLTGTRTKQRNVFVPVSATATLQNMNTRKITRTITTDRTISPPITNVNIPFTPVIPPFGLFKLPFGVDSGSGLGKIKASRKYRYTPSFGALVKGEKFKLGEFTTKKFTGLEYRGSSLKPTKKKRKSKR